MIAVAYSHPDPAIAAEVANLFAKEFIDYNLRLNIESSMKAVDDLRDRATQQKDLVEALELKLAEYREQKGAVSLDSQENIAREQLAVLNQIKLRNKNELDNIETKWRLIGTYKRQERNLWELSFISEQMRVAELLEQVSSTRIDISSLSKRYREKHPVMIQFVQKLQEAELELELALNTAVEKVHARNIEAEENFEVASKRLAEKERELIELSKTRVEFNSLLRDLEVQQKFFQSLNVRVTTESAQVNLKSPNVRIVDKAFPPAEDAPSSPNVAINLAAGFFGGILIGLGLVFAVAFLDDRVKGAFDVEGTVGLRILGVVPRIKKLEASAKAQAVASNLDRHVTEAFRTIYSALKLSDESKNARVFLTTSTVPSEGKSFVSSNMALTFANHGERTILVDADLRLPNVAKSLQLENEVGVLDHINKGVGLDELILKEVYPNFDVLPTGGKSESPTQALNSAAFEAMVAELRDRYDRVVIDTPPLAAVSDALNVLPLVDGVLYVIKFNTVKRKAAVGSVRRLWESNTPVFGAIFNDVASTHSSSSYYYSSYSDKSYSNYYVYAGEDDSFEQELVDDVESQKQS